MKLSEAILLGSTILKPKARITFQPFGSPNPTHGCALGMAAAAKGILTPKAFRESKEIWRPWQWANAKLETPPPCGCKRGVDYYDSSLLKDGRIQCIIMHVFNEHVAGDRKPWTIDALAQWIASIEPQDDSANLPTASHETQHQGDIITAMEGLVLSVLKAVMTL